MDKCHYCERTFGGILDFPVVHINRLDKIPLPEIISGYKNELVREKVRKGFLFWREVVDNPEVPSQVLEQFKTSGKDICRYGGFVYERIRVPPDIFLGDMINKSVDVTGIVCKAVETNEVRRTMKTLENLIGKEVATADIRKLPGFKNKIALDQFNDFALSFDELNNNEDGLMRCKINLSGPYSGGCLSCAGISVDLAEMQYEGRIKRDSGLVGV